MGTNNCGGRLTAHHNGGPAFINHWLVKVCNFSEESLAVTKANVCSMQNDVSMMQYLQYYVSLLTRHVIEIDRWGSKCTLQLLHSGIKIRRKVSFIRTDVVGCANSEGLLTKNISDRLESLFFPQGRVFLSIAAANVYLFCNQAEGRETRTEENLFSFRAVAKNFC